MRKQFIIIFPVGFTENHSDGGDGKMIIGAAEMCDTLDTPRLCDAGTHTALWVCAARTGFVRKPVHCGLMHNSPVFLTALMSHANLMVSIRVSLLSAAPFCIALSLIGVRIHFCFFAEVDVQK